MIKKTTYAGWVKHPVYHVAKMKDYRMIEEWMYLHDCHPFLLSSGAGGYTFQVTNNHEWFVLKWTV